MVTWRRSPSTFGEICRSQKTGRAKRPRLLARDRGVLATSESPCRRQSGARAQGVTQHKVWAPGLGLDT